MRQALRIALLATTILSLGCWSSAANAQVGKYTVKTGYLTCHEASGWGFIFGSSREIRCSYSSNDGRVEHYSGSISKFGADIGYLKSAVVLWAVAAPTKDLKPGALEGHYGGPTAVLSLGVGRRAKVRGGGLVNALGLHAVARGVLEGLDAARGFAQCASQFHPP